MIHPILFSFMPDTSLKTFFIYQFARIWWKLPIRRDRKERIKTFVFTHFERVFEPTEFYRNWKNGRFLSEIRTDYADKEADGENRFHFKNIYSVTQPENDIIDSLAVVVHVFYPDILEELLAKIGKCDFINLKFYVTSPAEHADFINTRFFLSGFKFHYQSVENRGRDILPFLTVMPAVIDDGYKLVLKVHTKKSGHLKTGVLWRNDLYQKLLGEKPMMSIVNLFNVASDVGMVGPVDHVLPMHLFYGSNAATILAICRALTIPPDVLPGRTFIAGSMFYARINVIIPILNLGLQPTDFEPELGQVDGTLAHALERIFALSSIASGLQVVDSSWRPDSAGVSSTVRHKFIR